MTDKNKDHHLLVQVLSIVKEEIIKIIYCHNNKEEFSSIIIIKAEKEMIVDLDHQQTQQALQTYHNLNHLQIKINIKKLKSMKMMKF